MSLSGKWGPLSAGDIVVVESAYSGEDQDLNVAVASYACRTLALMGYTPIASHIYSTQFLDDDVPKERAIGINIGKKLADQASLCLHVAKVDEETSSGVHDGVEYWSRVKGLPVVRITTSQLDAMAQDHLKCESVA